MLVLAPCLQLVDIPLHMVITYLSTSRKLQTSLSSVVEWDTDCQRCAMGRCQLPPVCWQETGVTSRRHSTKKEEIASKNLNLLRRQKIILSERSLHPLKHVFVRFVCSSLWFLRSMVLIHFSFSGFEYCWKLKEDRLPAEKFCVLQFLLSVI